MSTWVYDPVLAEKRTHKHDDMRKKIDALVSGKDVTITIPAPILGYDSMRRQADKYIEQNNLALHTHKEHGVGTPDGIGLRIDKNHPEPAWEPWPPDPPSELEVAARECVKFQLGGEFLKCPLAFDSKQDAQQAQARISYWGRKWGMREGWTFYTTAKFNKDEGKWRIGVRRDAIKAKG